jgi:hypothetical protein
VGERDKEREEREGGERERESFPKKFETKTSRTDFPPQNLGGKNLNFRSRLEIREENT